MRAVFGNASHMWSAKLTDEQMDRWCAAAGETMSHPRLAQDGPLTGQQFFQSITSVRGCVGLAPVLEPPAPVTFGPSVVGRLVVSNDADGVRLWLEVTGELTEDVMVFGQEPCSAGRSKRRNVAYLGLLPPPIGGLSEITHLYKARYGEPRAGTKIFIVTCQTKDGWKGLDHETSARVPERPKDLQAPATPSHSQNPYMYKGGTRDAQGIVPPPTSQSHEATKPETGGAEAGQALPGGGGQDGGGGESPPRAGS
jgi:hypothetical protein